MSLHYDLCACIPQLYFAENFLSVANILQGTAVEMRVSLRDIKIPRFLANIKINLMFPIQLMPDFTLKQVFWCSVNLARYVMNSIKDIYTD